MATYDSLPKIVSELILVLTCDHMGLTLSNMTGLALHSSIPKRSDDDQSYDGSYLDSDEEELIEEESKDEKTQDSSQETSQDDEIILENQALKRKVEEEEATSSKSETAEVTNSKLDTSNKKFKSDNDDAKPSTSAAAASNFNELKADPKCYFEVRRWKQGYYTLITDNDNQIHTNALDLMLFFQSKSWTLESGGNVSYIARDEDSELLTVSPEENCLALVYRDEETLKFTKYVNANLNESIKNGCFYEISVVYYE